MRHRNCLVKIRPTKADPVAGENLNAITLGFKDLETAERYYGEGGLKNLYSTLGEGWGGRETVGGSPRGEHISYQAADAYAAGIIFDLIQKKKKGQL